MNKPSLRTVFRLAAGSVGVVFLVFGIEVLIAIPGPDDHFTNPSRQPILLGGPGKARVYVVMGDSTGAGRGGDYAHSIAVQTAHHLAQSGPVRLVNLAVSGAKVSDVLHDQLPAARRLKPDVVLLSVGANDVTHFTPSGRIETGLSKIIRGLDQAHPGVRIVITGCPDVGTARRFAQPLRWLAGVETKRVNRAVTTVVAKSAGRQERLVWAPIADEVGPVFAQDATLFAPDRFHPNDRGYAAWLPTLNRALDKADALP